jgi:hypothetical protein
MYYVIYNFLVEIAIKMIVRDIKKGKQVAEKIRLSLVDPEAEVVFFITSLGIRPNERMLKRVEKNIKFLEERLEVLKEAKIFLDRV